MTKSVYTILVLVVCCHLADAQSFASWTDRELILNNGVVARVIKLPVGSGSFNTTSYRPLQGEFKYFEPTSAEFLFELNGVAYSGQSDWTVLDISKIEDNRKGNGAAVSLLSSDKQVAVTIRYLLYPDNPAVRKNLVIQNRGKADAKLESVDIERLRVVSYHASTFSWIYSDYGRRKSIGPYESNMQDALTIVHNMDWKAGIVIGNEATGVLKRTSAFWESRDITAGLTHKAARYPFRKWIKAGESFTSPQVFTMVYNGQISPDSILNTSVPDFIRRYMGIRLSVLKEKPTFVYNTWNPFKDNINEALIFELAKAAADAGMKEFIIDDGWQNNYGDWGIDSVKFPNGLKPVFDYIKSLGMKPGLWISVGSASPESNVYQDHPEWFVRDSNGGFGNLQLEGEESDVRSACFSTGWRDHIKQILLKLSLEYGLEYLKLDFAVVSSAYVFDPDNSGCYSTQHAGHKDHHESMYVNYESMWELFDELHTANPNLFIDCTFEAMGGLQLIDYAMLKHAEGGWLSNFEGTAGPQTDLRVRNMGWWRSPAMPATALVIGNPQMQDEGWQLHIKSLAGVLPIMLGDPRQLSPADLKLYRGYAVWMQQMQQKHDIMSYRQDLSGFGEPMEGMWDGFLRINTETRSGGIVGVFRQSGSENKRQVFINFLDRKSRYVVTDAGGKVMFKGTGEQLANRGFSVTIDKSYDGRLFEVRNQP